MPDCKISQLPLIENIYLDQAIIPALQNGVTISGQLQFVGVMPIGLGCQSVNRAGNTASQYGSSILGGGSNIIPPSYQSGTCGFSTIGGGQLNYAGDKTVQNSNLNNGSNFQTISGGYCNTTGSGFYSLGNTIAGGFRNNNSFSQFSTISGGYNNSMVCEEAVTNTISGGGNNSIFGNFSNILGGCSNNISAGSEFSTILGGSKTCIGGVGVILGAANSSISNLNSSSIFGGQDHYIQGDYSAITGFNANSISANYSSISGGSNNTNIGNYSNIGGGQYNVQTNECSNIDGGSNNSIGSFVGLGCYTYIGGGISNLILGDCSVISSGESNYISCNNSSFILGGKNNTSIGLFSTLSGYMNTVSSYGVTFGSNNTASGTETILGGKNNSSLASTYSAIGGGDSNLITLSSSYSAILGGENNNTNSFYIVHIMGNNITANRDCTTFVNNLSIMNIPTSPAGLPIGSVWRSGLNILFIVT